MQWYTLSSQVKECLRWGWFSLHFSIHFWAPLLLPSVPVVYFLELFPVTLWDHNSPIQKQTRREQPISNKCQSTVGRWVSLFSVGVKPYLWPIKRKNCSVNSAWEDFWTFLAVALFFLVRMTFSQKVFAYTSTSQEQTFSYRSQKAVIFRHNKFRNNQLEKMNVHIPQKHEYLKSIKSQILQDAHAERLDLLTEIWKPQIPYLIQWLHLYVTIYTMGNSN